MCGMNLEVPHKPSCLRTLGPLPHTTHTNHSKWTVDLSVRAVALNLLEVTGVVTSGPALGGRVYPV